MKYIIHFTTGFYFSYFCKSLRGAKLEAGRKARIHNFIVNEENHIYIYEFDGMFPIASKTIKGWKNH